MSVNVYDKANDRLNLISGGTLYADNPIGSIVPYGGATPPTGWLLCDGRAISRSEYSDLFDAIGTTFGSGDGSTTFNLPDLRNRAAMGAGTNGTLGESQEDTTAKNGLSGATSSAGSHSHSVLAYTGAKAAIANIYPRTIIASNMETYTGSYVANADYGGTSTPYVQTTGDHTHPVSISSTDSETRPKNVRVNYIIKAKHTSIPADFMDAVDDAVEEALGIVSTMTVTKQGNYINGTNFYGRKVGKVAMIEIDGNTGTSIPWNQSTTVGVTTGCATGIIELNCVADMVGVTTGYDPNGNAIVKWIAPYCRCWVDTEGHINVFLANPASDETSYTRNLFIGGSYITQ